jgi:fatty acid desaturase
MSSIFDFADSRPRPVEWPTWLALAGLWLAFGALTYFNATLPWWIVTPVGAYLVAFHGSLQHEALHGHPTRRASLNEALVFLPLSLWIPYRRYKKLHLTHHCNDQLTDPKEDPESYYLDPQAWEQTSRAGKWLYTINNMMLGRFVLGPALAMARFISCEARLIVAGDREAIHAWLLHGLGLGLLALWIGGVCGMSLWYYVFGVAYWGNSLTMIRSYAEHRAHDLPGCRVIIVESNPIVSLLYLNNNLHMPHHELPRLPWYKLPAFYRAHKERLLKENCAYLMHGYGEIARRWLLKAKEPVAHPNMESLPRIKQQTLVKES